MVLTFLGTGAADWDINTYAKGTGFRRFSSALINDDLLIDPGPHIFHFAKENGTPDMFRNLRDIVVTHTHPDHFCEETVRTLCEGGNCTLWGDEERSVRQVLEVARGGVLMIDEQAVCSTLENAQNCLPSSIYSVVLGHSKEFRRKVPILINKQNPTITGSIGFGNGVYKLRDGIILVGESYVSGLVIHSHKTFLQLYNRIAKALERGKDVEVIIGTS